MGIVYRLRLFRGGFVGFYVVLGFSGVILWGFKEILCFGGSSRWFCDCSKWWV